MLLWIYDIHSGTEHKLFSLEVTAAQSSAQLEEVMAQCADKAKELCHLEKKAWQFADWLTDKVEAMVLHVESAAEEQVSVCAWYQAENYEFFK